MQETLTLSEYEAKKPDEQAGLEDLVSMLNHCFAVFCAQHNQKLTKLLFSQNF